jgi:L-ascorbate metabolism protein UlaG (beta-lactamase superfamily)
MITMDVRLIRNATLRLRYGGTDFLIDPMLGVRHAIRAMGDSTDRNPTVDLPCSIDEVFDGVDVVLVSHLHPDHFDEAAFGVVPRHLPVYCQPGDGERLTTAGFDVTELASPVTIGDVEITPVEGRHGSGPILERMGSVLGLVFRSADEPTVYWAGDTVLYDPVRDVIASARPDVVITHSGGATAGGTTILMDVDDTIATARLAPDAVVVAVHLEAVAHAPVTRADLRAQAEAAGIGSDRLRIPADGETITIARAGAAATP